MVRVRECSYDACPGSIEYEVVREHTTADGVRVLDEIRPISVHIGGAAMMTKTETALREWFAAQRPSREGSPAEATPEEADRSARNDEKRRDAADDALYEALREEIGGQ